MIKFKFLMYILFFLTIFKIENIKSDEDLYKFDFSYFTHFTLLNSNFIIFSNKGFFTFNSNFKLLYNYTFSTALTLDIETKKNYPSFTQFSEEEGGLVLCYILKNVYIFNDNGEFVYLTDANEASLANLIQNNYIINAYKRENSEYYYLVIYIDNSLFYGIIHIFYYKINIVNFKKDLVNYNLTRYQEVFLNGIKKVIVHSHTTGFKVSLAMRIRRFILNILLKRYVDVYFACSEDAANFKFGNYYSSKPIIVYNGIDINIFKFNNAYRNEIRNKYNIGNKYLIGSLGRLSFEKNNFFLLDILNKIIKVNENVVLMIAGNGEYYESLQQKCKALKLDNNVIFTGSVLDAYKYYSAFDIFLMPSFYEGMPVTAIEAQISGL